MSDPSDLQRIRQEIIDRLDAPGIVVCSRDRNANLADLLDAVERRETAAEQRGGLDEPIEACRLRVEEAIDTVRRHRKHH